MAAYQEKLLNGEIPTESDWNEYLRSAHAEAPGMTPNAFEDLRSPQGLNSYETLVEAFPSATKPKRILDLACGDGHLTKYVRSRFGPEVEIVGIDMSEHEVGIAKAQTSRQTTFKVERADQISEPDHSFDLIFCHMAFMLIDPLEGVIHELTRVLKPGGEFIGIVGGSPLATGFLPVYQNLFREFMTAKYPKFKAKAGGDPRTKSLDGLLSIFTEPLFANTTSEEFEVSREATPEQAWLFFKDMYFVTILPKPQREEFKALMIKTATEKSDSRGKVRIDFPMRLFKTRKV